MKKLLVAALVLVGAAVAQAAPAQPVYTCEMSFNAEGGGLQIIVGPYKLKGTGTLNCIDAAGNRSSTKVRVLMGSNVAPNIAFGRTNVAVVVASFSIANPNDVFGTYAMASAGATVGIGANASVALRGHNGLTLNASIGVATGAGAQLGFEKLVISRM